jgi:hypothetical protein
MSRSTLMKNALAQTYADRGHEVSLHTADPGSTGANDLGLTHAVITWPSPPDAGVVLSTEGSFTISAGTHITHVGLWDASGHFLDSFANNVTFPADTTYGVAVRFTA